MRFSLQTREIIADSIETMTCAQFHDANISIPGCDKNMPGVVMAMARHNRPSIMIYGGTIQPGYSKLLKKTINVTSCFEAQGAYNYDNLKNPDDPSQTKDDILTDIERHACPGPGACGGQFTANTMSTVSYDNFFLSSGVNMLHEISLLLSVKRSHGHLSLWSSVAFKPLRKVESEPRGTLTDDKLRQRRNKPGTPSSTC